MAWLLSNIDPLFQSDFAQKDAIAPTLWRSAHDRISGTLELTLIINDMSGLFVIQGIDDLVVTVVFISIQVFCLTTMAGACCQSRYVKMLYESSQSTQS